MQPALEIEVDGPVNEALLFAPLQRSIRGRYDFMRLRDPQSILAAQQWPGPIPGQRIGIDADQTGYLVEPLHDPEFTLHRERIEKKLGMGLEPKLTTYDKIDLPSWLFFFKLAVESGLAKVTKGKLPDAIDGEPRIDYINAKPGPSQSDKLTDALHQQTAAFNRLADTLVKFMERK